MAQKTIKELRDIAQAYFKGCDERHVLPTKAGLCLALDITRDDLDSLAKHAKYASIIARIENKIEIAWVGKLEGANTSGAQFYLKNEFRNVYRESNDGPVARVILSFDEAYTSRQAKTNRSQSGKV